MSFLWSFRWVCLYFLLGLFNVPYVTTAWPSSNSSNIKLLGLFSDVSNISKSSEWSFHSPAMFKAAVVLSQQYNITIEGQFIDWQSVETEGDVMNALRNTCLLMSASNIVGIVGPSLSRESHIIAPFAAKIGIPVISYASTDPELSDRSAYPTFYRTVPSDNTAALAIAKLFIQFNWTSCLIIYQNDAFGSGGAKAISDTFSNNNLIVTEMIVFDIVTRTIRGNLKSLLTSSSTRIVLVWADVIYTELMLQNALDYDVLGPQFTWILTSNVMLNNFNQTWYQKLSGMLTVVPVTGDVANAPINKTLLNAAYNIWQQYEPETFPGSDNVNYYALFAFDATWSLIQSLKQLCSTTNNNNSSSCLSFTDNSFCFDRRFLNSSSFFNIIDNNAFLGISGHLQFSVNVTDRINGSYYVAKNVQLSSNGLNYVPVLVWSDSSDWRQHTQNNVIVWPGDSYKFPTSYATVSGVTLRIAVIESPPFTMVTKPQDTFEQTTTKFTGYVPDLIELLQNKMGFIPNIILAPLNETYNGLIDAVANGVYDMVVADTTITATRREKVAFSSSIYDNSLRIVIREASTVNVDFLSYLRPFSLRVWITLLVACIYAGILICFLERQDNEALRDKPIIHSIAMSMWYSIGTLVGYGVDFHVRTAAGRLLTVGLYILSLILVAAYTANLASNLTISKSKGIISGIDDIKNGKLSFSRIGILINSSIEDYYLREISGGSRNFSPLKSQEEAYGKLLDYMIDAAIIDSGPAEYFTNKIHCNLTVVGTDFDKTALGIVYQKKWLYEHDFDVNLLSLRESGALDDLKRKWFQTNYCSRLDETSTAMPIESMAGLFLTFVMISILAVLLFVWIKRLIIKDYLLTLTRRKSFSVKTISLQ